MRELPVTVALSLLVHLGAVAWFATRENSEGERRVARQTPTVEVTPPIEEPPVEVALLDDNTVTQFPDTDVADLLPAAKVPARHQREPKQPAIAATTTTTTELPPRTEPPPTEPPKTKTSKPSILSMRDGKPEPLIHRPGSDGISDEALKQMVDGDLPVKISNLPGAREDAEYDRAQTRLHNKEWVANATPDELTGARLDREAAREAKRGVELVPQKDGTHRSDKTTFGVTTNRDGTVAIKDKPNIQGNGLGLKFDVTDGLMRKVGQDPYASAKLEYLDRTRDQRVEIGKRYRSEQLAQSAQLMAVNLGRLWSSTTDPARRKQELFALWDECAESGDAELVAGGSEARRLLINWVHTKHVEFTPAELTAFNARKQSKSTFAP